MMAPMFRSSKGRHHSMQTTLIYDILASKSTKQLLIIAVALLVSANARFIIKFGGGVQFALST